MIIWSAKFNTACTLVALCGRAGMKCARERGRRDQRVDFVVSGEARKIVTSLKGCPSTGCRFFLGIRFSASHLPQPLRELIDIIVDEQFDAQRLLGTERDYFPSSGFGKQRIFNEVIAINTAEQKRRARKIGEKLQDRLCALRTAAVRGEIDTAEIVK